MEQQAPHATDKIEAKEDAQADVVPTMDNIDALAPLEHSADSVVPSNIRKSKCGGISLALGGGVARGWAHIGVLRAFDEAGIEISMIAGTSIGALVGGYYLAGKLDDLEDFARSVTRANMLRLFRFYLSWIRPYRG